MAAKDAEMADTEPATAPADGAQAAEKKPSDEAVAKKPSELEEDAPDDSRLRIDASSVAPAAMELTPNAVQSANGKLLTCFAEGGCQFLFSGARSTVGLKAGRYMFEIRIVEYSPHADAPGSAPKPRQLVRVGFTTPGSSMIIADGDDSVGFDSEGFLTLDKLRKKKVGKRFERSETIGVLLNLDADSPNANTISLFRNGIRACEPQALPECLKDKVLCPTVTYRCVSLQLNLGPAPLRKLPFVCRLIGDASADDADAMELTPKKNGKNEVVFPIGLPDRGYFDWVDSFVARNRHFFELSDRKIIEWAVKSGVSKPKPGQSGSNDKPLCNTGLVTVDDMSAKQILAAAVPTLAHDVIVPEMRANLLPQERKAAVQKFSDMGFHTTAIVLMGEPDEEYKEYVHSLMLKDKLLAAEAERKRQAQAEVRKKLMEERKRKVEESKKLRQIAQAKKEGRELTEEELKAFEEAAAPEVTKEEPEAVPVELTEEEKKTSFRKMLLPDLTEQELARNCTKFALPTSDEGFDEIKYIWQEEAACQELMKAFLLEKKRTQRIEDLEPGAWFKEQWAAWTKLVSEWKKMQSDWKIPAKKKAILAKRKEDARKKKEEEAKENGVELADPVSDVENEERPDIDPEDVDCFSVEDVKDLGNGDPLFMNFDYEDWMLMQARFELHTLICSFKKDAGDPDRPSFGENHLPFYYHKYFRKIWNVKQFYGMDKLQVLLELIKDTVTLDLEDSPMLKAELGEETQMDFFLKLTENCRRDRQRRMEAGDETALLKFPRAAAQPTRPPPAGLAVPTQGPLAGLKRPFSPGVLPQAQPPMVKPRLALAVGPRPPTAGVAPVFTPRPQPMRPITPGRVPATFGVGVVRPQQPVPTFRPSSAPSTQGSLPLLPPTHMRR